MVFLALTNNGLREALALARQHQCSVWCTSEALSEEAFAASKGPMLTRLDYSFPPSDPKALADADLQALLAEGGLTQAALTSGQMAIEAVVQAHARKESAKGLAQQATQDRNAAAAELDQWLRHFWKIAEVALADQPQWLERLGRRVRS